MASMLVRIINALLALYLFIFVFAVPMLMLDWIPVWGQWMGGFLLALQGVIVLCWLAHTAGARGAVAGVLIGVLSFAVEYIGVTTGVPFGAYTYTPTLGTHIGVVPYAIPFAWIMVVPGALLVLAPVRNTVLRVPLAAVLALLLDMLLEPIVTHVLDYWRWIDGGAYYGVPVSNFLAWGVTAFVLLLLLVALVPKTTRSTPALTPPASLFLLTMVQFTLVNLAHGFWWAVAVGALTLFALWLLWGRPTAVRNVWRLVWI